MTALPEFPPAEIARIEALIRREMRVGSAPLVPELRFWLADDTTEIWQATEEELERLGIAPPFWATAWPGGQALARYLLDHPETVRGRRVISLASGAGLEAIAAAKAGAAEAQALDLDPAAAIAARMNAALNGVRIEPVIADLLDPAIEARWRGRADLILVGDAFYEQALSAALNALLRRAAGAGVQVLIGDPARAFPPEATRVLAAYDVVTDPALEDRSRRHARVLVFDPV